MHIEREDSREVVIEAGLAKARDLLDGLIAYRAELGELGRELEYMLRAAGVTPSPETDHEGYECMPPPDFDHR
jgi:hypothetical protein